MCDFCGLKQRSKEESAPSGQPGEAPASPLQPAAEVVRKQAPEKQKQKPAAAAPDAAPAAAAAGSPVDSEACARLVVKVERGDGLLPMDVRLNPWRLSLESTLDAFVQLRINEEKPFAETEVRWHSKGDAEWNQVFSVDIKHPKSYLVLFVCDDDPVLRKDSLFGLTRNCGFLEIPLWVLPRQQPVRGWFVLSHPDTGDAGDKLADRQEHRRTTKASAEAAEGGEADGPEKEEAQPAAAAAGAPAKLSAGRVRLELTLQTTFEREVRGHMGPAPAFERSLPALDVPGFFESVGEVKRLLVERLLLRPILMALYAISWQDPALSTAVLCWHWLLCFRPRFIWASVWLLLLLCFWHDVPSQAKDAKDPAKARSGIVGGTMSGLRSFASETYSATTGVFTKPLEGAKQGQKGQGMLGSIVGGTAGFVKGTAEGAVGLVTHTGKGVIGLGMGVGGGVVGTIQGLRAPGLEEFQHMIHITPSLRDLVRAAQRPAKSAAAGLQSVDDVFYWRDAKLTQKVVLGVGSLLLLSLLLSGYMGVLSGYMWLLLGSVVLVAQASFFNTAVRFVLALLAVATKPKAPFSSYDFFDGRAQDSSAAAEGSNGHG